MQNKRIIIIENNTLRANGLVAGLNAAGAKSKALDRSNDTDGLIKELWFDRPDIILVNIDPGHNWQDTISRIKSDEELMHVPVVSFTQYEATAEHPAIDRHLQEDDIPGQRFLYRLAKIIKHL